VRQAGRRHLGQQLARARLEGHAALADQGRDAGHEPLGHQLGRCGPRRLAHQVAHRALQAAAEQLRLVGGGPVRPEPGHDGRLGLEPERLGVDEQPVHVEQDRIRAGHTLITPIVGKAILGTRGELPPRSRGHAGR
jgi:hypothetical protein